MGNHRYATNIVAASRIVRDLGGKILEVLPTTRHLRLRAVTRVGNRLTLTLSKSKTEPYKLRGWLRQEFNKADAAASRRMTNG